MIGAWSRDESHSRAMMHGTEEGDTKMRVCPSCGKQMPEDAISCPRCGKKVETGESGSASIQEQLKERRRNRIALLIIVFIFTVLGSIFLAFGDDVVMAVLAFVIAAVSLVLSAYNGLKIGKLQRQIKGQ